MPVLRLENFPPFADNSCLGVLVGNCSPFLSKVRWGKHYRSGNRYAFAELSCPEDCVDEVMEKVKGAAVLGNKLHVSKVEKRVPKRAEDGKEEQLEDTKEDIQNDSTYNVQREKHAAAPEYIAESKKGLVESYPQQTKGYVGGGYSHDANDGGHAMRRQVSFADNRGQPHPKVQAAANADACKYCGSDKHFSRKCPQKNG